MQHLSAGAPRFYAELAAWWPLLSAPGDYAEEAAFFRRVLNDACDSLVRTLLELGSGGGNNASHLKSHFQMTLVDFSAGMLDVSRALNPECEHVLADMRTIRLGRMFDAVFIHDAIMYMTTQDDLRRAMETAHAHCRPGGAALFAPDYVRETFAPGTDHGGHDAGGCGLRYLEWTHDPDPNDTEYTVDFAFLLREPDGRVHLEQDRHILGLFPRETWLRLLRDVGFNPNVVRDPFERDVFVGLRPT